MRIYAELPDGKKSLYSIRCDGIGCDAELKPGPNISSSGWMKCGTDCGLGTDKMEWDYCSSCWNKR